MQVDDAIQERKSVRKFSDKKPDWRDIIESIDATRFAPMAGNNFSLKFILVRDKKKIEELSEAAQQPFVGDAHYLVVVCSYLKRTLNSFGERGQIYARQQAGAAIQNFLLKITDKGLGACWVGHFVEEHVKRALKIPDDVQVEAIIPVGYESKLMEEKRAKRVRVDLDNVLYFEDYGTKKMKEPRKLSA